MEGEKLLKRGRLISMYLDGETIDMMREHKKRQKEKGLGGLLIDCRTIRAGIDYFHKSEYVLRSKDNG